MAMTTRDLQRMKKDELVDEVQRLQQQLQQQQRTERVSVNTSLPRDLRDQLRAYASGRGLTLQSVIQQAVEDLLQEQGQ